uniref:hypothetical protein n=1 Tax=uncultured Sphingomonas sp. TaxID=158754 RepID=UPI0035CB176F
MYDAFGYPGMFAADNAGPARYADRALGRYRSSQPLAKFGKKTQQSLTEDSLGLSRNLGRAAQMSSPLEISSRIRNIWLVDPGWVAIRILRQVPAANRKLFLIGIIISARHRRAGMGLRRGNGL